MIKGLLQKEWIKTRWVLLAIYVIGIALTIYDILGIQRVVTIKGVAHLWEILLTKDVLFISAIKYQPLATSVVLAVAQFVPEMIQKRLKLTLHLPVSQAKITTTMLTYGVVILLLLFGIQYLILYIYLQNILAPELTHHLLVSIAPWFIAGLTGYGMTSLITLEPTWRRRIVYLVMGYGPVHLSFVTTTPRAYEDALIPLLVSSLLICYFSFLSIQRFKEGAQ